MFILWQCDSAKYLKQVCNKTAHSAFWCGPGFIWASKMSQTVRFPTPPMDILHSKKTLIALKHCLVFASFQPKTLLIELLLPALCTIPPPC